jgi:hypothetical protein
MAGRKTGKAGPDHLEWWKTKLARMSERTFVMPVYGPQILDVLMASAGGRIDASNLKDLGRQLGVPLKFVPRALACVTRLGIVSAVLRPPTMSVTIHPDRFARRKIGLRRSRRLVSLADREFLKAQSNYRCACCGTRFGSGELVVDHLIPLSLLGADAPENWVVMSKEHNARKWDRLLQGELRFYRGERVRQRFGVRFIEGAFWPVINGKLRYSRPKASPAKRSRS